VPSPAARLSRVNSLPPMSPFWIWTQVLIVIFVLASIVIAITKLA
jgi:hypothetical protein